MIKVTLADCIFKLMAEQDDTQVRGNAMASGDESYDKEIEDAIIKRLDDGDIWAWASVRVECHWTHPTTGETFIGADHLGCCSYESEKDFRQVPNGYFEDMKCVAFDEMAKEIERTIEKAESLEEFEFSQE